MTRPGAVEIGSALFTAVLLIVCGAASLVSRKGLGVGNVALAAVFFVWAGAILFRLWRRSRHA